MPNASPSSGAPRSDLEMRIAVLLRRLIAEASQAVDMLESAMSALWTGDLEAAREVRGRDDRIDKEEVQIEQEALRMMALDQPVARDFRYLTFIIKVNADAERLADHASSIAKVTRLIGSDRPARWPVALRELGQRVPQMCHAILRAVLDEDVEAAKRIVAEDKTIDDLEKRLFEETLELVRVEGEPGVGMLIYRIGRELERSADLATNIAEDLIYLVTGEIVRHEVKRALRTPPA